MNWSRMIAALRRLSVMKFVTGMIFMHVVFLFAYFQVYRATSPWNSLNDPTRLSETKLFDGKNDVGHHSDSDQNDDDELARELSGKVRVLCWVMTGPQNHVKRAKHVKETWGKRCNVLLFMSSVEDKSLPSVVLSVGEGRDKLWGKTMEGFRYAWNNYKDQADWFMKADDDSYVILENLRYFLSAYNSSEPIAFGHKFRMFVKKGYPQGGAGYVLSKEATKKFVEQGLTDPKKCKINDPGGPEDVEIGKCLENLNISLGDTRDSNGRGRFFPHPPEFYLGPNLPPANHWIWTYIYYPPDEQGLGCCSDTPVSFHYVTPQLMYVIEYLIYHVKLFGIRKGINKDGTPAPPPDSDLKATPWPGLSHQDHERRSKMESLIKEEEGQLLKLSKEKEETIRKELLEKENKNTKVLKSSRADD